MPLKYRRVYLSTIRERYKNAPKTGKKVILDEFCNVCGYSRKYAIRILNGTIEPRAMRPGPKPKYKLPFILALKKVWESMGMPCSRSVKKMMPRWVCWIKNLDPLIEEQLLRVSTATIDRLLRPYKIQRGLSTTQMSVIKHLIPIKLLDEDVTKPGYIEADTVAHCGGAVAGEYIHSLTMVDIYSHWVENRAIWTKKAEGVQKRIESVEERLPFQITAFACDNGTEFLNQELVDHFTKRRIEFVRRRPYKKNDSAHVEQRNWTHVRKLLGYERFDHEELVPLLNEIYQAYWNPLKNFFYPTMKLKEKVRVGSKIKRIYDEPKTPYDRLIESPDIPLTVKRRLTEEMEAKNPFYLKSQLDKKLKEFFQKVDELDKRRDNLAPHSMVTFTHDS